MSYSKKNTIVLIIVFIAIGALLLYFKFSVLEKGNLIKQGQSFESIDISKLDISSVSDQDIANILQTNQDAKDYIVKNPDFKIQEKDILTKDNITEGQDGQNFKEVYQDLELEENRYLKVILMNLAGDSGLISVIDFKDGKVLKAYGLVLLKAESN